MPSLCSILTGRAALAAPSVAVVGDAALGHQEKRDAAAAGRRAGQAGEDEMDDVLRHVVIAPGDEDLLAADAVGAVAFGFRAGAQGAEVGAGLRLGQVHRAGPFAGNQLAEIERLLAFGAVRRQRLDRAARQHRAEPERHVGAVDHLEHRDLQRLGQALAAISGIGSEGAPAARDEFAVGGGKAGDGADLAVDELGADAVAVAVERRQLLGGEPTAGLEDRRDRGVVAIGEFGEGTQAREAGDFGEREQKIADGRRIGHERKHRRRTGAAYQIRRAAGGRRCPGRRRHRPRRWRANRAA